MLIHKVLEKYKKIPLSIKVPFWFIVCNCIQKLTQLITTPIYTRILTQEEFGDFSVFLSWVELVAIFTTLDIFYSGYNTGMQKFKNDREKYTSSMQGLCFTITSIWLIVVLLFSNFISSLMHIKQIHLILLVLYMYIFPTFQFYSARKKFEYKYVSLLIVTILSTVLTITIGTIFAINFNDKSTAVIVAKIISELIISIPLFFANVSKLKYFINVDYWKYALKFNIPLIPHYISTMILNHSDRIMIKIICSASFAAIYSIAYSIAMIMTIVQNAINSAIIPWLYDKLEKKSFDNLSRNITKIIIFVGVLNYCIIIIAPEIIQLLSTKEYLSATLIIPPITLGIFLTAIYSIFVNVEFYYNNNIIASISSMLAALINIVLNYIFINKYGYLAAGYTTLFSYLFLTICHYFGYKRVCKKENIDSNKIVNISNIFLITIFLTIISLLTIFLYKLVLIRYAIIIIITILIIYKRNVLIKLFKEGRKK